MSSEKHKHRPAVNARRKYRYQRVRYAQTPPSVAAVSASPVVDTAAVEEASRRILILEGQLSAESARAAAAEADLAKAKEELSDNILRTRAEMENQRRRLQKDREDFQRTAAAGIMQKLIQPLDHLELAMLSVSTAKDVASLAHGFELIGRELQQVLEQSGLERVAPLGQRFDPNFHDAAGTASDPTKGAQEIVEVMRPGYILNGRVLRPALVRVNMPPADAPAASPESASD